MAAQGGGGGNFGIFTSFTVRPVSVPATVTVVTVQWPASAYAAAIQWYQGKMPTLDVLFSSDLFLGYGSAQVTAMFRPARYAVHSVSIKHCLLASSRITFICTDGNGWHCSSLACNLLDHRSISCITDFATKTQ